MQHLISSLLSKLRSSASSVDLLTLDLAKNKGIDESVLKYLLKFVFGEVQALALAIAIVTAHTFKVQLKVR